MSDVDGIGFLTGVFQDIAFGVFIPIGVGGGVVGAVVIEGRSAASDRGTDAIIGDGADIGVADGFGHGIIHIGFFYVVVKNDIAVNFAGFVEDRTGAFVGGDNDITVESAVFKKIAPAVATEKKLWYNEEKPRR